MTPTTPHVAEPLPTAASERPNFITCLKCIAGFALLGAAAVGSFNSKYDWVGAILGAIGGLIFLRRISGAPKTPVSQ